MLGATAETLAFVPSTSSRSRAHALWSRAPEGLEIPVSAAELLDDGPPSSQRQQPRPLRERGVAPLLPAPKQRGYHLATSGKSSTSSSLAPTKRWSDDGESGSSSALAPLVRHTVDLYVPAPDLSLLLAWSDRLEAKRMLGAGGKAAGEGEREEGATRVPASALVQIDKERRLLALAQTYLCLEKKRRELAQGQVRS